MSEAPPQFAPRHHGTTIALSAARLAAERRNADRDEEAVRNCPEARGLLRSPAPTRQKQSPAGLPRGARGRFEGAAMEPLRREAGVAAEAAESEAEVEAKAGGWLVIQPQAKLDVVMLLRSVLGGGPGSRWGGGGCD